MTDELKDLQLSLLLLQRSALIDIQTVLQVMVDKGLCTLADIEEARCRIESDNPDIQRINAQIVEQGGEIPASPVLENHTNMQTQLNTLRDLLKQLTDEGLYQ